MSRKVAPDQAFMQETHAAGVSVITLFLHCNEDTA